MKALIHLEQMPSDKGDSFYIKTDSVASKTYIARRQALLDGIIIDFEDDSTYLIIENNENFNFQIPITKNLNGSEIENIFQTKGIPKFQKNDEQDSLYEKGEMLPSESGILTNSDIFETISNVEFNEPFQIDIGGRPFGFRKIIEDQDDTLDSTRIICNNLSTNTLPMQVQIDGETFLKLGEGALRAHIPNSPTTGVYWLEIDEGESVTVCTKSGSQTVFEKIENINYL